MNITQIKNNINIGITESEEIISNMSKFEAFDKENPSKNPEDRAQEMQTAESNTAVKNQATARLRKLKFALKRVDSGDYGHCIDCDEDINPKRLATQPEAERCTPCQSDTE
jgi:DnaK suppressor protein